MQFFVSANPSTTCCDSISRSVSDGTAGSQTAAAASFCCPSYENRILASSRTELNAALGMYSSPYAAAAAATQNYANYFPYSSDPSAIYSTLVGSLLMHKGGGWLRLIDQPGFVHQCSSTNVSVLTCRLIRWSYLLPLKSESKILSLRWGEEVEAMESKVVLLKCHFVMININLLLFLCLKILAQVVLVNQHLKIIKHITPS